ncbi:MAG: hypothetical protein WDN44_01245 [Sphingomonas sp.]
MIQHDVQARISVGQRADALHRRRQGRRLRRRAQRHEHDDEPEVVGRSPAPLRILAKEGEPALGIGQAGEADADDAIGLRHALERRGRGGIRRRQDDHRRYPPGILLRDVEQIGVVGGVGGVELHAASHLHARVVPCLEQDFGRDRLRQRPLAPDGVDIDAKGISRQIGAMEMRMRVVQLERRERRAARHAGQ